MGSSKPPKLQPLPEAPALEEALDPEIRDAREKSRKMAAAAGFGRRSTILAGGIGGVVPIGSRGILGG